MFPASQCFQWKCSIWSGSNATSEGIYDFIVDIKFMMVADSLCAQICCSFVFYVWVKQEKMCQKNCVSRAHRLIGTGSDATSEGIYDFIVDIKFMMVADDISVQVPYLSTTRRDAPKECSCLACSLLLLFCQRKLHRCHTATRHLHGHGSSYRRLLEDSSGRSGLEV